MIGIYTCVALVLISFFAINKTHISQYLLPKYMLAETPFEENICNQVVVKINNNQLTPDHSGKVILPNELIHASKNGTVYVTRNKSGVLMVLFLSWIGKGSNLTGYLYVSKPISSNEIHKDYYEQKYSAIDIMGPGLENVRMGPQPIEVILGRKLSNNYFYVYRNLD